MSMRKRRNCTGGLGFRLVAGTNSRYRATPFLRQWPSARRWRREQLRSETIRLISARSERWWRFRGLGVADTGSKQNRTARRYTGAI